MTLTVKTGTCVATGMCAMTDADVNSICSTSRCGRETLKGNILAAAAARRHAELVGLYRVRAAEDRRDGHSTYTLEDINDGYQDMLDGKKSPASSVQRAVCSRARYALPHGRQSTSTGRVRPRDEDDGLARVEALLLVLRSLRPVDTHDALFVVNNDDSVQRAQVLIRIRTATWKSSRGCRRARWGTDSMGN